MLFYPCVQICSSDVTVEDIMNALKSLSHFNYQQSRLDSNGIYSHAVTALGFPNTQTNREYIYFVSRRYKEKEKKANCASESLESGTREKNNDERESPDDDIKCPEGESDDDDTKRHEGESHDDDAKPHEGESHDDDTKRHEGESHDDDTKRREGESHDDDAERHKFFPHLKEIEGKKFEIHNQC